MNKDYSKGARDAREDGESNRLASRSFKQLFTVSAWLPGASNRMGQYREGYATSHKDVQRVINTQNSTNTTVDTSPPDSLGGVTTTEKGRGMGSQTSFEQQLNILREFESNLNNLRQHLEQIPDTYQQQINKMGSLGFADDYIGMLQQKHRIFSGNIEETMRLIDQQGNRLNELHRAEIARLQQVAAQQ